MRLLVLDVDGVLTDGGLYFGNDGEALKRFSILDGLGIKMLADNGVASAIITGRRSGIVEKRAAELSIAHLIQGREDKRDALLELQAKTAVTANQIAYVGDDLPDIGAIMHCQLGIAVANAHAEVKQRADWVCSKRGGNGAVREVADMLLQAQGRYSAAIDKFTQS
ncbi:MAG: HAD hydrolase family protein [Pseudomonadales bacterium]|nr:HAD hydrolase family protein [Pseudomonadales bacterium]